MDKKIVLIAIIAVAIIAIAGIVLATNNGSKDSKDPVPDPANPDPTPQPGPEPVKTVVTVMQSDGNLKTVKYNPERVVVLSTYTTEVMMFMGLTDKIVAVTNSSKTNVDQKEYLENAVDIGNFNNPDYATLAKLNPDLIINYGTQLEVAKKLDELNLPYVNLQCASLDTMITEIRSLGTIFGTEDIAEKYIEFYESVEKQVKETVDKVTVKKTVYMESFSTLNAQGLSSAYTVLARTAGADLIYTEEKSATVSAAWVVEKNPDAIIKTPMLKNMLNGGGKNIHDEICSREGFGTTTAVKDDAVFVFCSQLFGGPRCFGGLVACCNALYGGDLSLTKVLTDYNTMFGLHLSMDSLTYPGM